ncbi:MAG: methyltransferase domain-containing protein [Methylococcales symbiont of Hymedesmia sp. n. MRB-2018]|nr:MAG: methyltransferase domain-containing protein [Methylococcales symbiont of Hymedesmia sp. n. MRB-2018]KAF3983253.1 MAG: methyltransferase domain-containing protein [Methylococcales symbiont of Hymedesmia sp. n. MRB-2018]
MQTEHEKTKHRYNRIAPFFDSFGGLLEGLSFNQWREILWKKIEGQHILEVGVGTGKNFPFYPPNTRITAIDFSEKMLALAEKKKHRKHINVDLNLIDIQSLCYADNSFDTVIASFVFCSVPQPIKGLQELYRVCKPGGQVLLLEHVLSDNNIMAKMMQFMNPLVSTLFGANINRQTVKSVQSCGFEKVLLDPASGSMIKLIQAIK